MFAGALCAATARQQFPFFPGTILIAAFFAMNIPVRAAEIDTEHLFGFTTGSDVGKAGELEIENETVGGFGKQAGSYTALSHTVEAKFTPTDNFRVGVATALAYFDITGVPGLGNRQQGGLQGVSLDLQYRLITPERGPFAVTIIAEPRWGRFDDVSGEPVTTHGGTLTLAMDRELLAERLFAAFNAFYDSSATQLRGSGDWQSQSQTGFSAALSGQIRPALFVGGEVRYLRAYDGLALNAFAGQAVFAGPTMYLQINQRLSLSAAWNLQILGRSAAGGGSLDLTHFERQEATVRLGLHF
ncbi:MAG: hypothetical protein WDN50_20615 [Bradyrhizobium sp.]